MIQHKVLIPLALPIFLVLLALLLRLSRMLWFRFKQVGFPPIIIRANNDSRSQAFVARLEEYLARDAPGPAVIIPPGGGAAPPPVPVEQLYNRANWVAALTRIVLAQEPTFDVHIDLHESAQNTTDTLTNPVTVRITRMPGGRILAADSMQLKSETDLIKAAGCFIIHSIRQENRVMQHTPRWERWGPDIRGYAAYRRALDYERNDQMNRAVDSYDEAIHYESGNFAVSIRKASLFELGARFGDAAKVYRTCNELWPEHLETAYRLAASYANNKDSGSCERVLNDVKKRLQPWVIWSQYGRTWLLTRWNIGERHYWRSWIRRHPPIFGSNRRHELYMTVLVADQLRIMGSIAFSEDATPGKGVEIEKLLTRVASLTTRGSFRSCYAQLFHPECRGSGRRSSHNHSWHNNDDDRDLVIHSAPSSLGSRLVKPRRRIGWLAHYNAACLFSLALKIKETDLPPGYDVLEDWKIDCARAAIRELGCVRRDPHSELEPQWYRNDPALQPLRAYPRAARWAEFVGCDSGRERVRLSLRSFSRHGTKLDSRGGFLFGAGNSSNRFMGRPQGAMDGILSDPHICRHCTGTI